MKLYFGILCSLAIACGNENTSTDRIRDAAAKAISVIQNSQKTWFSKQSCFSCHQQALPAFAFRAAREHGVPIDEKAAHADAAAAFGFYSNFDRAIHYTHIIDPAMDDGWGLVAASAAGLKPSLVTNIYARLLAARQEPDGHWETGDERPPQSYSPFSATAIAISAIETYSHPSQRSDLEARVGKARAWLLQHTAHTTEERAFQIFGLCITGHDPQSLTKLAEGLKATQQADGGWSSREGRPSDAYSTGEALWAMHNAAGLPISDPAWQRGLQYLLKTQANDGTWHVTTRLHPPAPVSPPYFETGHPYGHDQFISTMGESWAVAALAAALPEVQTHSAPLTEAEPHSIEPWAETMLFGTAADLKKLLDSGFDPNAATKAGGTTALMLAAPDVAKMKLLLDRGAKVDARSKDRYSALLVAANYPGSSAAINLLLDRGATVRLPQGQGAPQFNDSPTILAAFAGNADVIARLHKAGDRVDDRMNLLGMFPATPLLMLATWHRTASVKALLDAGAPVDQADDDGITPLAWAAISNRVETARVLIEHGADVNHVDKKGMTPLLYAASIDLGDPSMTDLLLRSGAKPSLRNKDGLTALDLAHKYGHSQLVAALQDVRSAR